MLYSLSISQRLIFRILSVPPMSTQRCSNFGLLFFRGVCHPLLSRMAYTTALVISYKKSCKA
ncbi:hypothetical protein I7I50_08083 [Histoplasma capsulatum G186AR]|uniref:Uncharacterized protein n=1 Tax=Ajellomyces capsulatus TaxID=5037 RepID=A0A8H7YK64_AJECA|nr:hypothetical protein I7I52_08599 [Histoplasma capsulatum]QSS68615.1 hypothetical protein I7I50_08083 [Histoplasma capsulatum G186AR]